MTSKDLELPITEKQPQQQKQPAEEKSRTSCGHRFVKKCIEKTMLGSQWVWKDLKQPHLFWVKVVFMLQSASLVTLYPYLIVHLRSLGFTIEDASIVNTAVPLADIIAPPAAGILADKLGNFRIFMVVITFLNGASSLLLLTVDSLMVIGGSNNSTSMELNMCCFMDKFNDNTTFCYYDNSAGSNVANETSSFHWSQKFDNWTCHEEDDFRNNSFPALLIQDIPAPISNIQEPCKKSVCSLTKTNSSTRSRGIKGKSNNWMRPTFWHYLAIRVVLDIFRASSLMLFEGAVVAIIKEHGGDYGLQKLFGTLGGIVLGPLSGQLIDWQQKSSVDNPSNAYVSVILLYFVLRTVTAVCLLKLGLDFKPPAKKVIQDVWKVMRKVEVISYLLAFLVSGILWGFLENFLFWLLEDLGSTKFLMGMSLAVGTLAGLPLTIFSGLLVKKLGHRAIMLLSLVLYAIRIAGYSLITTPEWFLIFEALKPFCTTLLLIAVFGFIKANSPLTTAATVECIFGAAYFGVGRGLGGLIGGFAIDELGVTMTFQFVAAAAAVTAVIYLGLTELRQRLASKKYILPQL